MAAGKRPLDWAAAEALAFARLAAEGHRVRLSGQDTARGTFSQRHAEFHDTQDGAKYTPLQHVASKHEQAPAEIINSPLSEAGVLGFEYGYSLDYPDAFVGWEAQFGDFWNAAQVIVDQFIVSGEEKWRQLSGLTLLLPHGFEGMGPEHSSARLERFLLLAARDNLQLVYPSTPAQYFHVLCRQVLRPWRKPLIVITPKSLLRLPQCVSPLEEFAPTTKFQRVIGDLSVEPQRAERILLCSGKIYYELLQQRQELQRNDTAIIRVEQFYPSLEPALRAALAPYRDGVRAIWVQEEPENMGAWRHLRLTFDQRLLGRFPLSVIARPASASPATGSSSTHRHEQKKILQQAFSGQASSLQGSETAALQREPVK